MTTETNKTAAKPYTTIQFIAMCVVTALVFPGITLLLADDPGWGEGWIYGLWFDAMMLSIMIYTYLYDPALMAERSTMPGSGNQKRWDTYLMAAILIIALLWLVIMPLDARRFGWSPAFPLWLKILGGVALLPSLFLIFRATTDNTFLSAQVRIQADRKQHVVSTGVYGFVRHPLYLGVALLMIGAPLLLGSVWGLILSGISFILLIIRIIGEEKMLIEELEGYEEYKMKVKYRLIPFIW